MPIQTFIGANKIPRKAIAHTLTGGAGTGDVVVVGDSAGGTKPPPVAPQKTIAVCTGTAQAIAVAASARGGDVLVFDTTTVEADFTTSPFAYVFSARYQVAASVTVTPTTGLGSYALYMRRNGICDAYSLQAIPNGSDVTLQFTATADVVAGDEIEFVVKAKNTTAGSLDINVVACSFTIYKTQ